MGVCRPLPLWGAQWHAAASPRCPRLLPPPSSAPPRSRRRGAHEGGRAGHAAPRRPPPPFHCPRRPIHAEKGRTRGGAHHPTSPRRPRPFPFPPVARPFVSPSRADGYAGGHARAPPRPRTQDGDNTPTPVSLGAGDASPAPRTQEDGAPTPSPLRGRRQPHPMHITPHRLCTQGEGSAHPTPPRGLHQPPVFTHPATPADAGGSARPAQPPSARAERGATRVARGVAREWKGGRIGAGMRKGDGDGDGGGVVNEAKRSRGEAARANSGHPAPVDRLRKIHVKSS
ncbi:hypothetical protein EDB83DRAFT_2444327 [Lactarius deliciosus]|nr:hypothetical protein EDB83DRAFT_2444327 [Lactarius deliciosus]